MVDVAHLIWSESDLLTAVRRYLDDVKCRRDSGVVPCSPIQCGSELRAHLLDGRERETRVGEEGDEVMPEDVSHLMRHDAAKELRFQIGETTA